MWTNSAADLACLYVLSPMCRSRLPPRRCREGIAQMRQQWTLHDEEAMHGQGKHTMVLCRP